MGIFLRYGRNPKALNGGVIKLAKTLRIEIKYIEYNKLWEIRIGDLSGSMTETNCNKSEILSFIEGSMKELI